MKRKTTKQLGMLEALTEKKLRHFANALSSAASDPNIEVLRSRAREAADLIRKMSDYPARIAHQFETTQIVFKCADQGIISWNAAQAISAAIRANVRRKALEGKP